MHVLGLVADEEISVETPHRRAAPGTGRGRDVEHNGVVGHRGHGGVDVGRHELGRRVLVPDSLVGSDVSAHVLLVFCHPQQHGTDRCAPGGGGGIPLVVAATVGASSRCSPSCSATVGWPPATSAAPTCTAASSPSPPPSPATSASPPQTRSCADQGPWVAHPTSPGCGRP